MPPRMTDVGVVGDSPGRIFGLLIGIDDYQSHKLERLSGAVADTEAFLQFFSISLNVPATNFHVLHNRSATRKAIIDGFTQLKDDERIQHGDAIFIFYAGHGSEMPSPPEWEAGDPGRMVQVIIPYDYCEKSEHEVQSIPDRTLGALIEGIAEKKGNNITVVLDCCHSASGTRGPVGSRATGVRFGAVDHSIHHSDLDRKIWSTRPWCPPLYIGLDSHILLAACRASEQAHEANGRGVFTTALLDVFLNTDISTLRYSDIIKVIDIPRQHPQCEGVHSNRHIFRLYDLPPRPTIYTLFCQWEASNLYTYNLNAGSAHGLTTGDELTVYPDIKALYEYPSGTLLVDKIYSFSAKLKLSPSVTSLQHWPPGTIAVKSNNSQREILKLGITPSHYIHQLRSRLALESTDRKPQNIVTTDKSEEAHLTINISDNVGELSILITDPRVTKYGITPRFKNVTFKANEIFKILKESLNYHWELNRTNSSKPGLRDDVHVDVYKLHTAISPFPNAQYELFPHGPSLAQSGEIKIIASANEHNLYGVKITNKSKVNLYPHVYYFNPEELSIVTMYEPPAGGPFGPAAPLRARGGTLPIGYGCGGRRPFTPPPLKDDQMLHVGFLKVFLFAQPLNRFSPQRPSERWADPTWDTMLLTIVNRRDGPKNVSTNDQPVIERSTAHGYKTSL